MCAALGAQGTAGGVTWRQRLLERGGAGGLGIAMLWVSHLAPSNLAVVTVLREEQHATWERLVRRLKHEVLEGLNGKPC